MIKFIKNLFKKNKKHETVFTLGERDEHGYCDIYADGKETSIMLFTHTKEQVDRLKQIEQKIMLEFENNKKNGKN